MKSNPWILTRGLAKVWMAIYYLTASFLLIALSLHFGKNLQTIFQDFTAWVVSLIVFLVGVVFSKRYIGWALTTFGAILACIGISGLVGSDVAHDLSSTTFEMVVAMPVAIMILIFLLIVSEKMLFSIFTNLLVTIVLTILCYRVTPQLMPLFGLKVVYPSFADLYVAISIGNIVILRFRKAWASEEQSLNVISDSLPFVELFTQFIKRTLGAKISLVIDTDINKQEENFLVEQVDESIKTARQTKEVTYNKASMLLAFRYIYIGVSMLVEQGIDKIPDRFEPIIRQAIASKANKKKRS